MLKLLHSNLYNSVMKPIQIVMDDKLLVQLDQLARRAKLSRSAFIREAVVEAVRRQRNLDLHERERAGYAAKPVTAEERQTRRSLQRDSDRVFSDTGERW